MDLLISGIKCTKCRCILSDPIVQPCGHSICQSHTIGSDRFIVCQECNQSHLKTDLIINKNLKQIIASGVGSIDFGQVHHDAKKACNRLENELTKTESTLNDLEFFIHERIEGKHIFT